MTSTTSLRAQIVDTLKEFQTAENKLSQIHNGEELRQATLSILALKKAIDGNLNTFLSRGGDISALAKKVDTKILIEALTDVSGAEDRLALVVRVRDSLKTSGLLERSFSTGGGSDGGGSDFG